MRNVWAPSLLAASLFFSVPGLPASADDVVPTLEMGLVESGDVQRIALDIGCGGKSYSQTWETKFAALLADCDVDANGSLNQQEASRLPSARALREASSSGFAPVIGATPEWDSLDQNNDGRIMLEEVSAYYRRHDVGLPTCGIGIAPFTADLNSALQAQLDRDGDGVVSLAEWQQAESILQPLDQNDDELIGAGELVAGIVYPGTSGCFLLEIPRQDSPALADSLTQFPLTLLPPRHDDVVWTDRLKDQDAFPQRLLDAKTVAAWRDQATSQRWQVNIGDGELALSEVGDQDQTATLPCLKMGRTWLTVRADVGQLKSHQEGIRTNTQTLFQEADEDKDGRLTRAEWSASGKGFGSAMAQVLDRDGDDQISQRELDAWLTLQQEIGSGLVMLTAIDCGQGLLELLDTNRNGALSRRELRVAPARLEEAGCLVDGKVDLSRLPRQILVTISLGPPDSPLGKIQRQGPDWFLSMDRNLDGDVSPAEFVGGDEAFQSLDADGDQLLTVEEVERLSKSTP